MSINAENALLIAWERRPSVFADGRPCSSTRGSGSSTPCGAQTCTSSLGGAQSGACEPEVCPTSCERGATSRLRGARCR